MDFIGRLLRRRRADAFVRQSRMHTVGSAFILIQHFLMAGVGLLYFVEPSVSLQVILGVQWPIAWSFIFTVFGLFGAMSRILHWWHTEIVAEICMALGMLLWGIVVLAYVGFFHNAGSLQAGGRFIAGAFYMTGWALTKKAWMDRNPNPHMALVRDVTKELKRRTEESDE